MTLADEIREHVKKNYVDPARKSGERIVAIKASDIHRAMGLQNHFPSVCQAIDSDKFLDYASVTLFRRAGPPKSSSVGWIFDLHPSISAVSRPQSSPIAINRETANLGYQLDQGIELEKQGNLNLKDTISKSVEKGGSDHMKKIVLISCVKSKLNVPAKAKDLYISPLFKYFMQYAFQLNPDAIYILSAKYGLLELEQVVTPYEMTLKKMGEPEKKAWAKRVIESLKQKTDLKKDKFIVLASVDYRKYLIPEIGHYEVPLEGLGLGKQLHELKKRVP